MQVVWIYADAEGVTRIEELEIPLSQLPTAGAVTEELHTESVVLWESQAESFVDYHPATRRQLVPVLAGTMEVELEDGTTRRITAGEIVLMDDLDGRGHRTRWLPPGGRCVMIRTPELDASRFRKSSTVEF